MSVTYFITPPVSGSNGLTALLKQPWLSATERIFSSPQQPALAVAEAIAEQLKQEVVVQEELGEIKEGEAEIEAQQRIVLAVSYCLAKVAEGKQAVIVSHGAVGALLLADYKKVPINQSEDPTGQGYYFIFENESRTVVQGWTPIDEMAA